MSTLHKFDYRDNLIPELSDEEIKRRAKLIYPCSVENNEMFLMEKYGDPIKQSFSWSFKKGESVGFISYDGLLKKNKPSERGGWYLKTTSNKVGEFLTLHNFAYYGFFKPSIGEIVSQLPAELFDEEKISGRKLYFTNKMISEEINTAMLDQNYHIAKTAVYIEIK